MRVLVTGSTGFLGGRLIQCLSQNTCYQLLLGTRDLTKIPAQFTHLDAVAIDWTSEHQLDLACTSVDCVIHLAGMNAGQCARAGADELAADVKATEMLINGAINNKVKRFIYLSSAHVYSSQLFGEINELTEPTNTHPYALNHLDKERLVLNANKSGKLEAIIIRLSNAFGAPVDSNADCWMLLVNDLCRQLALHKKMTLKTTGLQRRDFITVSDFCNAMELLLSLPQKNISDHIYNLGGNWTPTVFEMASLIARRYQAMFGQLVEIERMMDTGSDNNSVELIFNIDKLKNFGYEPSSESAINDEIDLTIDFCVKHFI